MLVELGLLPPKLCIENTNRDAHTERRVCVCVCCVCVCVQLCSEESLYVLQGHTAFTTYRVQRSYGCGWEGGLGQSPVPACAVACLESLAVIPLE